MSYYLHWSFQEVLGLEHWARTRLIEEVGRINRQVNGEE